MLRKNQPIKDEFNAELMEAGGDWEMPVMYFRLEFTHQYGLLSQNSEISDEEEKKARITPEDQQRAWKWLQELLLKLVNDRHEMLDEDENKSKLSKKDPKDSAE